MEGVTVKGRSLSSAWWPSPFRWGPALSPRRQSLRPASGVLSAHGPRRWPWGCPPETPGHSGRTLGKEGTRSGWPFSRLVPVRTRPVAQRADRQRGSGLQSRPRLVGA